MKKILAIALSLSLLVTMSTGFADKQTLSASNDIIENIALPDIIEEDEAIENKYVGRLTAMEQDLSTFIFANEDGTQTLRMFSHPVKFVNEKGETKDITLDIAPAENGGFKTKDNSIITTFEKKLADGISLEYDDIDITMKPKLTSALSVASSNGKTVTYPYGLNTKIEYSLTYTGFKEDIVVEEYTGQTEYEFTLYTNGLKVEKIGEGYKVVDGKGNIKANIGDIIIFTADERNNTFGELTCETVKANEEYLLTIHIDADYLSDPNTAYPIRIDPTIEINYSGSGETAIQDVTINSNAGSDGSSSSLMVGNRETYGISRILMKFPGLSVYQGMDSDQIIKATVELRDVMCETQGMTIYCYPFTGNTWNESTASWSNVNPNSYGARLSSSVISYATGDALPVKHRYSFDITAAVETWTEDTTAFSKGIIFKASSDFESSGTYKSKTFASYERASNQPSLLIITPGSVQLVGVTNPGHDHSTCLSNVSGNFSNCGFYPVSVHTGEFSVDDINAYLDSDSNVVFVSRSHGGVISYPSGVQAGTALLLSSDDENGVFYRSTSSMNDLELSNMKLILFVACSTGKGGETGPNLPSVAVSKGAETAIGFEEDISCGEANLWTQAFISLSINGYTVKEACELLAQEQIYRNAGLDSYVICGNKDIRIVELFS